MLGVFSNAYAKFQKNSINIEYRQNTWYEGGLCPILPIDIDIKNIMMPIEIYPYPYICFLCATADGQDGP